MSSHTSWFSITTGHMTEATFRFTIHDFNNRPEKFKESVKSPCFKVNGPGDLITKWQLEIYPKGRDEVYKKYVGIILNNIGQVKVAAKYKIDIIDGAGEEREQYESQVIDYDIGRGITFWGQRNWLSCGQVSAGYLRSICEERLCSTLDVANCVEYLMLGHMYHTFML